MQCSLVFRFPSDRQKGFDLIAYVMDELCQDAVQIVVLGTGEERYENMFRHFDWKYHARYLHRSTMMSRCPIVSMRLLMHSLCRHCSSHAPQPAYEPPLWNTSDRS